MEEQLTFNVQFRYSDERDYRLRACGIPSVSDLQDVVSGLAGLTGVQDIRIGFDLCYTDFQIFVP